MSAKWILKALVQKGISFLPYSNKINHLFQRYVTKGIVLNQEYFFNRITHARDHLDVYRKTTGKLFPDKTLELGSGWYPIVPIYLYLTGSKEIWSIDIVDYSSAKSISITVAKFIDNIENGLLNPEKEKFVKERIEILRERVTQKSTLDRKILQELNIRHIIANAVKTDFGCDYFDLIHSNNTLEHIPDSMLCDILKEFTRILNSKGVQSHFIDLSDHFAHFDRSISIYNFLRFSDFQWRLIDNSIQPQNRMRIFDYKKVLNSLNAKYEVYSLREGDMGALKSIKLNKKYKPHPLNELAVSHCHFIITRKPVNLAQ